MDNSLYQSRGAGNPFLPQGTAEQIAQQQAVLMEQMQRLEAIKKGTQATKPKSDVPLWDDLDGMTNELSEMQMELLQNDPDYKALNEHLSEMLQAAIVMLAKPVVENSENGNKLLNELIQVVKSKRNTIIKQTNADMKIFAQFQEYVKKNPNATYSEFTQTLK